MYIIGDTYFGRRSLAERWEMVQRLSFPRHFPHSLASSSAAGARVLTDCYHRLRRSPRQSCPSLDGFAAVVHMVHTGNSVA
ncbi:hypothetical protein OG21DRAFT_335917 [Imleria badia]|nr:hypothetical protein OG21DRAFT_335917 [Imleria badia]